MQGYSESIDNRDCTVRALANASGMPYQQAYDLLAAAGRCKGRGMYQSKWLPVYQQHMTLEHSEYLSSSFPTVTTLTRKLRELGGTYIVTIRQHVAVCRDGEWIDWLHGNRRHHICSVWKVLDSDYRRAEILEQSRKAALALRELAPMPTTDTQLALL